MTFTALGATDLSSGLAQSGLSLTGLSVGALNTQGGVVDFTLIDPNLSLGTNATQPVLRLDHLELVHLRSDALNNPQEFLIPAPSDTVLQPEIDPNGVYLQGETDLKVIGKVDFLSVQGRTQDLGNLFIQATALAESALSRDTTAAIGQFNLALGQIASDYTPPVLSGDAYLAALQTQLVSLNQRLSEAGLAPVYDAGTTFFSELNAGAIAHLPNDSGNVQQADFAAFSVDVAHATTDGLNVLAMAAAPVLTQVSNQLASGVLSVTDPVVSGLENGSESLMTQMQQGQHAVFDGISQGSNALDSAFTLAQSNGFDGAQQIQTALSGGLDQLVSQSDALSVQLQSADQQILQAMHDAGPNAYSTLQQFVLEPGQQSFFGLSELVTEVVHQADLTQAAFLGAVNQQVAVHTEQAEGRILMAAQTSLDGLSQQTNTLSGSLSHSIGSLPDYAATHAPGVMPVQSTM
ncbi:MAG TPA: hypothetical protein VFX23_13315 [Limnobacter sp.]|uniref:hypothetical protein n=1 Tax=Limnobacter sp. TaxID=2003368 RepID=UPI002E355FAB|nr:hypothetical protein [Limnobacter sp.]HEX5486965.1 hypothetical protein [Limnobacter sp.]